MFEGWTLSKAVKNVPALVYAWGVGGIAAAGGLVVHLFGSGPSAIKIWILIFLATILVAIFAQAVRDQNENRFTPGHVLLWATVVAFCAFLIASATASIGWGPEAIAEFWGFPTSSNATSQSASAVGGSVSFGCGQGATATVAYNAPPGWRILNYQIYPYQYNASSHTDVYPLGNNGQSASGKVDYFGRHKVLGNCPGGGQGSAQLVAQLIKIDKDFKFPITIGVVGGIFVSISLIVWNKRKQGSVPSTAT